MNQTHLELLLAGLSALAGAAHVLAPDHWLPLSVIVWQRGWKPSRVFTFALAVFFLHVLAGFALYEALGSLAADWDAPRLFAFSVGLMALFTAIRSFRFSRVRHIIGLGPLSRWALFAPLLLLGPAESAIPIFVKANQLGVGYLLPFLAYFTGTFIAGGLAISFGRRYWNRPLRLVQAVSWAHRKSAVLPFAASVLLGLTLIAGLR